MLGGLLHSARLLAGPRAAEIVRLDGVIHGEASKVSLSALYAGSGANRDFLARVAFDEYEAHTLHTLRNPLHLRAAVTRIQDQYPVLLSDLPPLWNTVRPLPADLRFPAWVRQHLDLPAKAAVGTWLLSRSVEREVARLTRRHDYTVDFVSGPDALRQFFRELYGPYISTRFGTGAIVVSEKTFLARSASHTLARLHSAGKWVAGLLLAESKAAMKFGWFGAQTTPPSPGASDVLDVACIRRAWELGLARITLGNSRPSLADGVVRYKSKLGAHLEPTRFPQAMLGIGFHGALIPQVIDRLHAKQLLALNGNRLATTLLTAPGGQLSINYELPISNK